MKTAIMTAAAREWHGEHTIEKIYYGTYRRDIPDPHFRFNISVVDHTCSARLHSHEYAELVIVLGGRALHLTEYDLHPIAAGDVLVIHPRRKHSFEKACQLKLGLIMYDPQQFLGGHRELRRMMGFHALFDLQPRSRQPAPFKERLHLSAGEMVDVTSLVSRLEAEFAGRIEGRQTMIRSAFLLLVTFLCRAYARHQPEHSTPLVRMARVISHVQQHFREPLSVEELARLAHWSPSQFQRSFKRAYHTTPMQFILQLRLQEACERLKDPNVDITTVALETGFASSSYFATQFKECVGESPSCFRRRHLAEQNHASSLRRQVSLEPLPVPRRSLQSVNGV